MKKAVVAYLIIIAIISIPTVKFFQRIKIANEKYREKMTGMMAFAGANGSCKGELFYKTGFPVQAIYAHLGKLYISGSNKKLAVVNLADISRTVMTSANVYTSFYSYGNSLYASDFYNDSIVQVSNGKKLEAKVGRPSALVVDGLGHYFASNYASGNITKIIGRDGFLFGTNLDQITGMEIKDRNIYAVRTKSLPSLVSLNLDNGERKIIDENKDFSSIASTSGNLLVTYRDNDKTKLGRIAGDKVIEVMSLDCSYPVKITEWEDKVYYVSMTDGEGKIFTIKMRLGAE